MKALFLFAISGSIGFIVDAIVYYLASAITSYYFAKAISFLFAVFSTWIFNRNITFRNSIKYGNVFSELIKYFSSTLLGGALNYFVFILLMNKSELVMSYPIIGIACGSIVGMVFNFTLSKLFIYKT